MSKNSTLINTATLNTCVITCTFSSFTTVATASTGKSNCAAARYEYVFLYFLRKLMIANENVRKVHAYITCWLCPSEHGLWKTYMRTP